MRVQFDDRAVQRQGVPFERGELVGLQFRDDALQHAGFGPAVQRHIDGVPVAKLRWQAAPGAALLGDEEQRIQDLALGNRQVGRRRREQGREPLVLSICQCCLVSKAAPPSTTTPSDLRATVNSP